MQIAFAREIFLLDLLHFFHTCDGQALQERLGDRLFDDDYLTVVCKLTVLLEWLKSIARLQAMDFDRMRRC